MAEINLKRKEAKTITFTIKQDGVVIDVSSATFSFQAKVSKDDATPIITKADGDFDKSQGANGIIGLDLSETDLTIDAAKYIAELKTEFAADNIDKSIDIDFIVEEAVIS